LTSGTRATFDTKDVAELADAGARLLESELVHLLTGKRGKVLRIKKVSRSFPELAFDPAVSCPTEVQYSHTIRNRQRSLITKIETLTLNDASEALNAVATLERLLAGLEKLRVPSAMHESACRRDAQESPRTARTNAEMPSRYVGYWSSTPRCSIIFRLLAALSFRSSSATIGPAISRNRKDGMPQGAGAPISSASALIRRQAP